MGKEAFSTEEDETMFVSGMLKMTPKERLAFVNRVLYEEILELNNSLIKTAEHLMMLASSFRTVFEGEKHEQTE